MKTKEWKLLWSILGVLVALIAVLSIFGWGDDAEGSVSSKQPKLSNENLKEQLEASLVFNTKMCTDLTSNIVTEESYENCVNDLFVNVVLGNETEIFDLSLNEGKATTKENEKLAKDLENLRVSSERFRLITPPAGYEDVHDLTLLALDSYAQYAATYPKDLNNVDTNTKYAANAYKAKGDAAKDRAQEILKALRKQRIKAELTEKYKDKSE